MDRFLDWSFSHPWLRTWVDELEPFHWEILLTYFCSRPFQNMLPSIWWVRGSQRVGEVGHRWVMGTNLLHQDEILGFIALGCHWVMSTLRIEGVITGSLESSWYCTWIISGLQVFTAVLCHELGQCKIVAKVGGMNEEDILILLFIDMSVLMTEIVIWCINLLF